MNSEQISEESGNREIKREVRDTLARMPWLPRFLTVGLIRTCFAGTVI